ncbi:MAG: hypothetical protein FDZ69_01685 [Deltaproteobacteria bacterium]|nr:MAG: hypothetical protein FDZ69_01685 [Deltaproteobacteria bacterium]
MKSPAPGTDIGRSRNSCPPSTLIAAVNRSGHPGAAAIAGEGRPRPADALRAAQRGSLRSLQLFLAISLTAFPARDYNLYNTLPESLLHILGAPPQPILVHLALAGYVFTVLTPLTIRLLNGDAPAFQWRHLGYRSAFYAFYLFSAALAVNFIVVLVIGVSLYLLEQAILCLAMTRATSGGPVAG